MNFAALKFSAYMEHDIFKVICESINIALLIFEPEKFVRYHMCLTHMYLLLLIKNKNSRESFYAGVCLPAVHK